MRLRIMSDLHLEFYNEFSFSISKDDDRTLLILAGDICEYRHDDRLHAFLEFVSRKFAKVIYVLGNHEFYGHGEFPAGYDIVRSRIRKRGLVNVHMLQNESIELDGIIFSGATLWTDYRNGDKKVMRIVERSIMDSKQIVGASGGSLLAEECYSAHLTSRAFIFDEVHRAKAQRKKSVLVVHHGVSPCSVHPRYAKNKGNDAFVSDLTAEILVTQPDLIFHGHTHDHFDYMLGNTRVIANPKGYPWEQHTKFDPQFSVAV